MRQRVAREEQGTSPRSAALCRALSVAFAVAVACPARALEPPPLASLGYTVIAGEGVAANAPIVIALHGLGDSAAGFSGLVRALQLPYRFVVPDAPLPWQARGYAWYRLKPHPAEDAARSTERLIALITEVGRRWPAAPRPFLLGFSQGAVMGFRVLALHPDLVRGVVAVAGYLLPHRLQIRPSKGPRPSLLIVHGRADKVVRFEDGVEARTRFEAAGYRVTFHPHDGPHRVPHEVVLAVRSWLLAAARE